MLAKLLLKDAGHQLLDFLIIVRNKFLVKKGYPRFKKNARSVEYKTSGWKLLDPKHIEFTDKKGIGKLKLIGT